MRFYPPFLVLRLLHINYLSDKDEPIISKMFSNSDFLSFQFLLHLLHIIELTYGRIVENNYITKDKLIMIEHLHELEQIFLKRTELFLKTTNLLDWKEARITSK